MFNRSADCTTDWAACIRAAAAIRLEPENYFAGLADPFLHLPKNILLFTRKQAFDLGCGMAHHRFLLLFCLQSAGTVLVDQRVANLIPRSALLVPPHHFHFFARFARRKLLWLFLSFELDGGEDLAAQGAQIRQMTPRQTICLRELASLYTMLPERQKATPAVSLLAALVLAEFLGAPKPGRSLTACEPPNPSHHLLHVVAKYVNRHVAETIRIADVAQAAGLSKSHLRASFLSITGLSLGAYIRRLRLHQARTLMLASDLRLKEIATRCGYDSIYAFSRAFHREMGVSPSTYRQRYKSGESS